MKILLTGATGFIGQHLLPRLLSLKYEICFVVKSDDDLAGELQKHNIAVFADNGSTTDLIEFLNGQKIEGVVHLASCFLVEHQSEQLDGLITANILFSVRILEAAAKAGAKWFLNTGTFWQHYQDQDYCPVNLYAATKQAFEVLAKYYTEVYGINFVTLKLSDTYGPGDRRRKIFAIWEKIAKTGEELEMSSGEQWIDICYIDDIVSAYSKLVEILAGDENKSLKGKSFAATSGQPIKLKQLAEIYANTLGVKLNINWGAKPYRTREVMLPWTKGEKVPGWEPQFSLEAGIQELNKAGGLK